MQTCEQAYLDNTAVLVSTMTDAYGNVVEITDFAPASPISTAPSALPC